MMPNDSVEVDKLGIGDIRHGIVGGVDVGSVAIVVRVPWERCWRDRTVVNTVWSRENGILRVLGNGRAYADRDKKRVPGLLRHDDDELEDCAAGNEVHGRGGGTIYVLLPYERATQSDDTIVIDLRPLIISVSCPLTTRR